MEVKITDYAPYAYESLTISSTAVGLTASVYGEDVRVMQAFITLESAQIRFRIDGNNPTTTEGHLLEAGQNLTLENYNAIKNFRAIRTGSSDGNIRVTYFRG